MSSVYLAFMKRVVIDKFDQVAWNKVCLDTIKTRAFHKFINTLILKINFDDCSLHSKWDQSIWFILGHEDPKYKDIASWSQNHCVQETKLCRGLWVGSEFGWNSQWPSCQRVLNFWVCVSRIFLWFPAMVLWWRILDQGRWVPRHRFACHFCEKWSTTLVRLWAFADGGTIAQLEQWSISYRCFWNLTCSVFMVCPTYWDRHFLHVIK